MSAFDKLMAFQRDTTALGEIAGRLHWDQETTMPRGAAAQRGAEVAAIEGILHARRTAPEVGEWLAKAEAPATWIDMVTRGAALAEGDLKRVLGDSLPVGLRLS